MKVKTVSLRIKGRVQGVGFRYFVFRTANQLGVNGYVVNCPNGDVYIEAETDEDTLIVFIDQCRIGPIMAEVNDISIRKLNAKGYSGFSIEG